jgi:hypothetical protein
MKFKMAFGGLAGNLTLEGGCENSVGGHGLLPKAPA